MPLPISCPPPLISMVALQGSGRLSRRVDKDKAGSSAESPGGPSNVWSQVSGEDSPGKAYSGGPLPSVSGAPGVQGGIQGVFDPQVLQQLQQHQQLQQQQAQQQARQQASQAAQVQAAQAQVVQQQLLLLQQLQQQGAAAGALASLQLTPEQRTLLTQRLPAALRNPIGETSF